ncbi:hypothetical protein F4777DRAFT_343702 [Nemania sp. FL0916]|nr:hypothetical protein F4777DRAFT_343702 [Nemania sp. FL0916]
MEDRISSEASPRAHAATSRRCRLPCKAGYVHGLAWVSTDTCGRLPQRLKGRDPLWRKTSARNGYAVSVARISTSAENRTANHCTLKGRDAVVLRRCALGLVPTPSPNRMCEVRSSGAVAASDNVAADLWNIDSKSAQLNRSRAMISRSETKSALGYSFKSFICTRRRNLEFQGPGLEVGLGNLCMRPSPVRDDAISLSGVSGSWR